MQKTKNKANKGFTLVELIVVIGIIGILAVVAIVAFGGIQASAQRAVIQATANQVVTQLNLFNGQALAADRVTGGGNVTLGGETITGALGGGVSPQGTATQTEPGPPPVYEWVSGGPRSGIEASTLDDGILFIIHPSTISPLAINTMAGGRDFINSTGNVLMELGVEPVGNMALSTQIVTVIQWDATLGRWYVNPTTLASMP